MRYVFAPWFVLCIACTTLAPSAASAFNADEQMQFADGLYARGLYEMALSEYLAISREADDFDRLDVVLFRIAECQRRLGNPELAERFFHRVVREHPDSAYAQRAAFRRAELHVTQGRYLDAINQFRALLTTELEPELAASARYYKGYAARRLLLFPEAEEDYNDVITKHPDSPFASYAALELAELYASQTDRAEKAPALYEKALRNPATPRVGAEALFQLGDYYFRTKNFKESAQWYDRLLREYPKQPRAREAALQAGWAFHNAGRHADGLRVAEETLSDEKPDASLEPDWLYLKANCLRQLLRAEDARAAYQRIMQEYPDHPLASVSGYETALIAFRQNEYEQAIEDARGLVAEETTMQHDLNWLLAESYAAAGRDDEAVQHYRLLIEEENPSAHTAQALYRLARLLQQRRDFTEAVRLYRRLVKEYPDNEFAPQALFSSAYCLAVLERMDDAINEWSRVLKEYPEHELVEEALYQKGLAELQLDKRKDARATLEQLLKAYPDTAFGGDATYWLGVLHEQDEDWAAAEKQFRDALKRKDDQEFVHRVQFRLALNLQKQDKDEEAASLLLELLDTPARRTMPSSLLEWIARHTLAQEQYQNAAKATEAFTESANTPAWKQMAWSLRGQALIGLNETEEARAALEQSVAQEARTRDGAEAALYLGRTHLEQKQYTQATTWLEKAAELASPDALLDVRANSYFELARVAEAEENWDRAARYYMSVGVLFDNPELTPESLYRAAHAFGQAGREREQQSALSELRQAYPDSPWTAKSH